MTDTTSTSTWRGLSFLEKAAWLSLLTPLFALLSPLIFLHAFYTYPSEFFICAFLVMAASFSLGLNSLFRYKQHQRRLTVWIASIGVLFSGVLVIVALFYFIACNAQVSP